MQEADHILIPLLDGQHALAQIARVESGRALLFLTDQLATPKSKPQPLADVDVIAAICVEITDLPANDWPVIGYNAIARIAPFYGKSLAEFDTEPASHIEAFVNALQGLYPWDGFPDPEYFTQMLRDKNTLPAKTRLTADFPTPESQ